MELSINQRFKDVIPPLTAEEYANLHSSIDAEGCRDAIVVWNGVIVDGHNRHTICKELGIPFKVSETTFESEDAAVEWIMFNALARRNLNDVDCGRLTLRLKEAISARALKNCSLGGGDKKSDGVKSGTPTLAEAIKPIDTRKELSRISGLSHGTLEKIEFVDNEAPVVISDAMGKIISINKAALLTSRLKEFPEGGRETEAARLMDIESELQGKRLSYEDKIMKKLDNIFSSAIKDYEYVTSDNVDVYIRNTIESTESIIEKIDSQINWLKRLRVLFVNRDAAYAGPRKGKIC